MSISATSAALLGSIATAIAIFAGGLAVEAYKRRRDRDGMALALAGAIEALLGLIEARRMVEELQGAVDALEAGQTLDFVSTVSENAPFQAITMAYAARLGDLGGDLPFRVARFLCYSQGLQHDLVRLEESRGAPRIQAALIRRMAPLWDHTRSLGLALAADLKAGAGAGPARRRKPAA